MNNITNVSVAPLQEKSRFIKPMRMQYTQNGIDRVWDLGLSHASVAIVIFNKSREKLVLVKQFRPAVFFTDISSHCPDGDYSRINDYLSDDVVADGITTELCAGIVDKKDMSLAAIARDEVEEECGYRLQVDELQHIQTFRSAIGTGGAKMSLFYAEVSDEKKVSSGGGLVEEGEMIEVIEMSVNEVRRLISKEDINSPPFTLYGIQWFLRNKV